MVNGFQRILFRFRNVPLTLLLVVPAVGCMLADIRPERLQKGVLDQESIQRGRELLQESAKRHGGSREWTSIDSVTARYTSTWNGWINQTFFMPWPESPAELLVHYDPGSDNSRVTFQNGPLEGSSWGIQNWSPYKKEPGKDVRFQSDDTIEFNLPTLQFFFDLPFRMTEASVVSWAGERKLGDRVYDLVFLTWNLPEPQESVDQYIVWISRESTLVEYVQFTVRDAAPFAVGSVAYERFCKVEQFTLPCTIRVVDGPGEMGWMHLMEYSSIQIDEDLPSGVIYPDPSRSSTKY